MVSARKESEEKAEREVFDITHTNLMFCYIPLSERAVRDTR